jgi:hypothetical protein
LKLQGLFLGQKQRRALINGCSFAKLDEKAVRVGTNTVMVRCLDLLPDAVIVRVDGSTTPTTLTMDDK